MLRPSPPGPDSMSRTALCLCECYAAAVWGGTCLVLAAVVDGGRIAATSNDGRIRIVLRASPSSLEVCRQALVS